MSFPFSFVEENLRRIRDVARQSIRNFNEEHVKNMEWGVGIVEGLRSGTIDPTHPILPKTPKAPPSKCFKTIKEVTSTTNDSVPTLGRKQTLRSCGLSGSKSTGLSQTTKVTLQGSKTEKESIGANSTYVKAGPSCKESIGTNSTYVKDGPSCKESIGANSTYVIKEPSSILDKTIEEISQMAVEEAMRRPARLTRHKAKQIAESAAQEVQKTLSDNKCKPPASKTTLKLARKSLTRAKMVKLTKKVMGTPDLHPRNVQDGHKSPKGKISRKPVPKGKFDANVCVTPIRKVQQPTKCSSHNKAKDPINVYIPPKRTVPHKSKAVLPTKGHLEQLAAKALELSSKNGPVSKVEPKIGKENMIKRIANQGMEYQAKPLVERVAKTVDAPKKVPPKLMAKDLPLNQTYEVSSYDLSLDPKDRLPLPSKSEDDYGLDDVRSDDSSDEENQPKKVVPAWAQSETRAEELLKQYQVSFMQRSVFFESKKTTPDLTKIFTDIDIRLLSRKSSAVWHSPQKK